MFEKLSQRGVLSEELIKKLQEMKKFRNILVHKYTKVDDTLAYENLKEHHHDFKIFREEVLGFLKCQNFSTSLRPVAESQCNSRMRKISEHAQEPARCDKRQ